MNDVTNFGGRNAPIFVKLNSTGERLRPIPTIDCIGSRYLTVIFLTPSGATLQRVLRENVTFDRGEANRFSNWEIAVRTNHERLTRWATSIGARESRKQKNKAADTAANTEDSVAV